MTKTGYRGHPRLARGVRMTQFAASYALPTALMPATPNDHDPGRGILIEMYQAAVAAAAPGPVLKAALERVRSGDPQRIWIIAVGKAAHPMAAVATQALRGMGVNPVGGLIIAPKAAVPPHPGAPRWRWETIPFRDGDHSRRRHGWPSSRRG